MYVPKLVLTSAAAGGRRLDATRRLFGEGSVMVTDVRLLGGMGGDKGVEDVLVNVIVGKVFNLLLSTLLISDTLLLTPTFHS